jgi:hypothetical protein
MTTTGQQTADQIVEDEVRELVRRRGLDPGNGDAVAVRQLIDDVVADYADRRLVASMPAIADAGQVAKAVADRVIGMGRSSPSSTTRTSRRSGSTSRARSLWPRPGGPS